MKQSETLAEGCTGSSADSPYKQLIEPRKTCLTKIFCTFNPSSPVIAQQRSLVDLQDNDDKISIGIRPYQVDIDISLPSGQIVSMSIVSSLTIRQVKQQAWAKYFRLLFNSEVQLPEPWWHGDVPEKDVNKRLLSQGKDGSFLVRQSSYCTADITLYVLSHQAVHHFHLTWTYLPGISLPALKLFYINENGNFTFAGTYASLQKLIEHFQIYPLPTLHVVMNLLIVDQYLLDPIHPHSLDYHSSGIYDGPTMSREVNSSGFAFQSMQGLDGHLQYWLAFLSDSGVLTPLFDENACISEALDCSTPSRVLLHCVQRSMNIFDSSNATTSQHIKDILLDPSVMGSLLLIYENYKLDLKDSQLQAARIRLTAFAQHIMLSRDELDYLLAPNIEHTTTRICAGKQLRFCLTLPIAVHGHQVILASPSDSVYSVINELCSLPIFPDMQAMGFESSTKKEDLCLNNVSAMLFSDKINSCLQLVAVPNTLECLYGNNTLDSFHYIQRCCLQRTSIQLNVCMISSLTPMQSWKSLSPRRNISSNLRTVTFGKPLMLLATDMAMKPGTVSSWQNLSSWSCPSSFSVERIELIGCKHIIAKYYRATIALYCGDAKLCENHCSSIQSQYPGSTVICNKLVFPIQIANLPVASTLHFLVTVVTDEDREIELHAQLRLFDDYNNFSQGNFLLSLFLGADPIAGFLPERFKSQEAGCALVNLPQFPMRIIYSHFVSPLKFDTEVEEYDSMLCNSEDNSFSTTSFMYTTAAAGSEHKMAIEEQKNLPDGIITVPSDLVSLVKRLADPVVGVKLSERLTSYRRKRQRGFPGREVIDWLHQYMGDVPRENSVLLAQRLVRFGVLCPLSGKEDPIDSSKWFTLSRFSSIVGDESYFQRQSPEIAPLVKAETQMALANQEIHENKRLAAIRSSDLLTPLNEADKALLFRRRKQCTKYPLLLPKFLRCIDWSQSWHVRQTYLLLESWASALAPTDALQLLHCHFADDAVRGIAVRILDAIADPQLESFLLQLVQVLRFERCNDSPLARFLLRRALQNRRIAQALFWHLRSASSCPIMIIRCGILIEALCYGCGSYVLADIISQINVTNQLEAIAVDVKGVKTSGQRNELLRHRLKEVTSNSKVNGPELIYKVGDDLRKDMLTLQILRLMDRLWQQEGLDMRVTAYGCVAVSCGSGVIQVVCGAKTLASIQRAHGGSLAAFSEEPLLAWLQSENKHQPHLLRDIRAVFATSCAAYCVATYVLGIGDRHNDNIMITPHGEFFHIDFGHFLGNIKYKFGVKREFAPFVLTSEFIHVMGGKESELFKLFEDLCVKAFLILRKHANLLIALFAMMLSTEIPELRDEQDIRHLQRTLCLDMSREQAGRHFKHLIAECIRLNLSTQLNFLVHNLAH